MENSSTFSQACWLVKKVTLRPWQQSGYRGQTAVRRGCVRKVHASVFLFPVPNISLEVLQPSFPEIMLESHLVMIRVL